MKRAEAELIIIKYGGNAIEDWRALDGFARAIVALVRQNKQIMIVHGGGPQINHWLEKTHIDSHFIQGQRYTDRDTLAVVEMVLCGQVNKAIVRALQRQGISSVGISGQDGYVLTAKAMPELGEVGQVERVNPLLLQTFLSKGYTPVISPLGCDEDGYLLNINADYAAAHIAGKIGASQLLLMTNVAGVLDENQQRLPRMTTQEIQALTAAGVIAGGMVPKTDCALVALEKGCQSVTILDGSNPAILIDWLGEPESIGTQIVAE